MQKARIESNNTRIERRPAASLCHTRYKKSCNPYIFIPSRNISVARLDTWSGRSGRARVRQRQQTTTKPEIPHRKLNSRHALPLVLLPPTRVTHFFPVSNTLSDEIRTRRLFISVNRSRLSLRKRIGSNNPRNERRSPVSLCYTL